MSETWLKIRAPSSSSCVRARSRRCPTASAGRRGRRKRASSCCSPAKRRRCPKRWRSLMKRDEFAWDTRSILTSRIPPSPEISRESYPRALNDGGATHDQVGHLREHAGDGGCRRMRLQENGWPLSITCRWRRVLQSQTLPFRQLGQIVLPQFAALMSAERNLSMIEEGKMC